MVEGIDCFEKEVLHSQAIWRYSPIVFLLCLSTAKLHRNNKGYCHQVLSCVGHKHAVHAV